MIWNLLYKVVFSFRHSDFANNLSIKNEFYCAKPFDSGASSSDYVLCTEFAYKLIKTTQELLQETDSGMSNFSVWRLKNKNGAF